MTDEQEFKKMEDELHARHAGSEDEYSGWEEFCFFVAGSLIGIFGIGALAALLDYCHHKWPKF